MKNMKMLRGLKELNEMSEKLWKKKKKLYPCDVEVFELYKEKCEDKIEKEYEIRKRNNMKKCLIIRHFFN